MAEPPALKGVRQPPTDGPSGGIRLRGSDVSRANPIPLAMPYPAWGDKGCVSQTPGSWGLSPVELWKQAALQSSGSGPLFPEPGLLGHPSQELSLVSYQTFLSRCSDGDSLFQMWLHKARA